MKIAFGMIVFEGDYVLKECLECVYPFAEQILIAEGPVQFWQDEGKTTSEDNTNEILRNFPDPDGKIKIVHGQFSEKDEQCNAYMQFLNDDIDYFWQIDSDELWKAEDVKKIIKVLEKEKYTSVDVKSCSFYGGFDRYIGGFERQKGNFHRIFKVYPGSRWLTHRPPTMGHLKGKATLPSKHLDGDTLYNEYGVQMYHYSYVFPEQVRNKIYYYRAKVSLSKCIDNYFDLVYLNWVQGNEENRVFVESFWNGVHEFKPEYRPSAKTEPFTGTHPKSIEDNFQALKERFDKEVSQYEIEC
jgi:hypothetical protein|tara:strand:+ start:2028 stop:2924 length:897 start_codon:yes stop_codon:yes gene_type:complete